MLIFSFYLLKLELGSLANLQYKRLDEHYFLTKLVKKNDWKMDGSLFSSTINISYCKFACFPCQSLGMTDLCQSFPCQNFALYGITTINGSMQQDVKRL